MRNSDLAPSYLPASTDHGITMPIRPFKTRGNATCRTGWPSIGVNALKTRARRAFPAGLQIFSPWWC